MKFEYKLAECTGDHLTLDDHEVFLNELGENRWELCSIESVPRGCVIILRERELYEEKL